jgi:glycosyltransferase involved in cell wall biosynthesis
MHKLSVVVITGNEERNIEACLESVKWADEIVLVDSLSEDKTVEIARRYTDHIFLRPWSGYGHQKNYAVERTSHDWVLSLDADERVSPKLRNEIRTLLRKDEVPLAGYEIPRKAYFGTTWIRHGGWYPDYVLRLFKKSNGRFSNRLVHEALEVSGPVGRLRHWIDHYTYRSVSDFIERMNRYSTLSAELYFSQGRNVGWAETVFRSWFTFLQMYILRGGFLDGALGFQLAYLYAVYTFTKYAKLKECHLARISPDE